MLAIDFGLKEGRETVFILMWYRPVVWWPEGVALDGLPLLKKSMGPKTV